MIHRIFNELYEAKSRNKAFYKKLNLLVGIPAMTMFTLALTIWPAAESSESIKSLLISAKLKPVWIIQISKYTVIISIILFIVYLVILFGFQTTAVSRFLFFYKIKKHLKKLVEIDVDEQTLNRLYEIGYAATGEGFAPVGLMKNHFKANKEGFRCWISNTDIKNKDLIMAFFVISPLNKPGLEKVMNRDIRGASGIDGKLIPKRFKEAKAIYITEVYGSGYPYDACALILLFEEISKRVKECKNLEYLFARPVSDFGINHLSKNGFVQLSASPTGIWMKKIDAFKKLNN